ncbi:MAG: SDR family NAD(P)-dependent oxidoreductase [Bacteroidia bacterium]
MDLIKKYKGKKVFVTGAGGFIGSHLVEELVRAGAQVTALVHYNALSSRGNLADLSADILQSVKIEFGDVTDSFQMNKLVKYQDIVFHLAALIGIPYSYVAPQAYVSANITGTLNILEAVRQNNVSKLVVTSTSETYGTAIYAPIDEKHPLQGQSPYSATKIGADKIAESYYLSFSTPVCILRPFNTFGPRQSTRAVIPTIIHQALTADKITLGSLSPVRDMLYVKDTVRGFAFAGAEESSSGQVISVGTGVAVTIGDLVNHIQGIMGTRKEILEDSARIRPEKSEVMKLVCDNTKAKQMLGWSPDFSLEQGLKNTIDWFVKNAEKYDTRTYSI